ncbi:phosphonate ABC transporter ATP-binding protein [Leptothrix discophora]|uniref:Phosphonate ABC transporter ATP-binding protein n=1 Tax=Leptothrix discophora TaxID=89 RepID=A0ABT9G6I6_LEPDI|nr:phosphonate ABC transporter ATP-binding protein [Leptothrix discophora]MDP4302097.1 phosphonate ABC transporter ATP-binding protein [Leptothrix discophora]
MAEPIIDVQSLHKSFNGHAALSDVSFQVRAGEMVALLGASGSGKSTLLRLLNGLHRADAGTPSVVRLLGQPVQQGGRLSPQVRALRSRTATIFQQFNLVDRLSVMNNVLVGSLHRLPLWRTLLGRFPASERERAAAALHRVGIAPCAWQRASTLSGGQQQRAAISRALVQGAEVILADEPIASLDPDASRRVMALLAELNRELGVTVLVSLHQVEHAFASCPRTIALRHGRIVYDGPTRELDANRLAELYGSQVDELFDPAGHRPVAAPQALPASEALRRPNALDTTLDTALAA